MVQHSGRSAKASAAAAESGNERTNYSGYAIANFPHESH